MQAGVFNFVLCWLPLFTQVLSSWQAAPLEHYETSGNTEYTSDPGIRTFSHHEKHLLSDGSDLHLEWSVHANPDTISSLDLFQTDGLRLENCQSDELKLHVPANLVEKIGAWKHIVASDLLHGCPHLQGPGRHLYHRVVSTKSLVQSKAGDAKVTFHTQELASVADVFPYAHYNFRYMPYEAKEPYPTPDKLKKVMERRRLDLAVDTTAGKTQMSSVFTPTQRHVESTFKFNVPSQAAKLGWNWDYHKNSTRDALLEYNFPGGQGWVRFYKPYLKAHVGLELNYTSRIKSLGKPPHVNLIAEVDGIMDISGEMAAAMDFVSDSDMSMEGMFSKLDIPLLANFTRETIYMQPITIFLGHTPLTIDPGFS